MNDAQSTPIGPARISPQHKPQPSRVAAIGLMCAAVSVFAVVDASAKYLVGVLSMPLAEVVWLRFVVHALAVIAVLAPFSLRTMAKSAKPRHQLTRSALVAVTTACNFTAVKYLQLDQTVTVFFLSPLLVAALAGPILGEWVGWRRLLAIVTGFLGVLLVTRPGFGGIHWAVIFAFGAVTFHSLYSIHTRYMTGHDSAAVNLFYTPLAGVVLFCPFALSAWAWPGDAFAWALVTLLGATGAFGHWLLILAFKYAPAPVVAPFIYVALIPMSLLGFLVFGDIPTLWTLAGGMVVIGSGLYLLYRERHLG